MQLTVDRIEGDFAVCETSDREMRNLPLNQFDFPVKDGDIVEYDGTRAILKNGLTEERKEQILERFSRLKKKKG